MMNEVIKIGDYIVIQKQNYRKLHKLNKPNSCVSLGRDSIYLKGIEGHQYSSVFRLIPSGGKRNKEYCLEVTDTAVNLKDEIDVKISGNDNRNILDDGHSQKLSAAEIEELKSDASTASEIVETLITNSNTFHNKTEFSQEKYLKKKEKKYFEYLQIVKPNLRLITEIMYKLDPSKVQGIRLDSLSQIITLSNIHSEGTHLLYDSGSNGLVAAALLSAIGHNTNGKLIHMHPGNMSQKQSLLAMNFEDEQLNRCISVNVYSVLRQFYQGCDINTFNVTDANKLHLSETNEQNKLKRKAEDNNEHNAKVSKHTDLQKNYSDIPIAVNNTNSSDTTHPESEDIESNVINKSNNSQTEPKKPKWHYDNITASDLLKGKVDSLVITCKEDPQNIFKELIEFVKPGRPFVIYYPVAEPLQQLYLNLRSYSNVAALRLTTNWMRNYQVLPERTHPEVMMNCSSGFLLTGYVFK